MLREFSEMGKTGKTERVEKSWGPEENRNNGKGR